MSIRLGIVMDPIEQLNFKKDSSLAMLWAASDRGWQLTYMRQQDLYQAGSEPRARTRSLQVFKDPDHYHELGELEDIALADLDVILMRKDPPFDNEFIYSTYLLEAAERLGVLIVNKPQSLRDCNEKMFATQFPDCCPPLVVSRDNQVLRDFHQKHQDVIFKPLDGMGGASIFRVSANDPNLGVILETLTAHGSNTIMAQKYLPEIVDGDKRILLIDGEVVPYSLARIPSQGRNPGQFSRWRHRPRPATERARSLDCRPGRSRLPKKWGCCSLGST